MKTKTTLDFEDVGKILAAACAEALAHGWPVTVAVVDDGGHILGLRRLDGASLISAQLASAKAHTSALGRRESKFYEELVNQARPSFLSAAPVVGALLEGGVPIVVDGEVVGAIGVSGAKSHEDTRIARAGIAGWLA
ncbi:GlcG/HbpS family heme-binding protein [Frateuria aurantia]